ncbi:MAG: helix-turn-helix domain-containing protein [Sphingomonas sp.]
MSRINPRLAKLHRSFSVFELADLLCVHRNTVRQWISDGLPVIDGARPILILGSEFQAWWGKRTKARKRPCAPGQMYCLKCREPKAAALGMVEYASTNATTGNLKALCETCGTLMHQRIALARISARMPGLHVRRTQAPSSIGARAHPSPNCNNPKVV